MPDPQTDVLIEQLRRSNRRWKRIALGALAALLFAVVGLVVFAGVQASQARAARMEAARMEAARMEAARMEAARQRQGVTAVLAEVARLEQQARWAEARVALEGAESWLGERGATELRRRLEHARRDLDLVARLDAIRLNLVTIVDGHRNEVEADKEYEKALREALMEEVGGDAAAAANRVRESGVRDVLVAALDVWATCTARANCREWVLEVARRADPHPWRDRVRDPAVWSDRWALLRLAGEKEAAKQSPQLLTLLASLLKRAGGDSVQLLRAAQKLHMGDFWLNLALADVLSETKSQEAVGYYREALAVRPATAVVHNNLAVTLRDQRELKEAVAECRRAIALDPKNARAHYNLAVTLRDQGELEGAVAEYRRAIALDPNASYAHYNLAFALRAQWKVEEAVAEYRRAIALDPNAQLAPADNLASRSRYKAACWSALVASGVGTDAPKADSEQSTSLRRQALGWLRADLALLNQYVEKGEASRAHAESALVHWKHDPNLASVRDAAPLAKLPEAEREEWKKLWADVEALLKKCSEAAKK